MKFHHIGHATRNLESSRIQVMSLGYTLEKESINDYLLDVAVEFWVKPFSPRIEFVSPISNESPVWSILKRRSGAYHYGFEVKKIDHEILLLSKCGYKLIQEPISAKAFEGRPVAFLLGGDGSIIELISMKYSLYSKRD